MLVSEAALAFELQEMRMSQPKANPTAEDRNKQC